MAAFEGRVALVTGSGRGIGRAIALHLARRGADLIVNFFRNRTPAEKTAEELRALGRRVIVVKANVGDLDQLDAMYDVVESEFGRLDMLIHNAASGFNYAISDQKPKGWDWTMNINARSLLFGAQRAARLMDVAGGGAIVAISSLGSVRVLQDYAVVGTSKAAIEALVRYLAVEFAPRKIVVNAVSPGVVETDALSHFAMFTDRGQDTIQTAIKRTPAGRLCTPEDVAELVGFLCSPQASMICGQTITIDGGFTLPIA
jgi:enoyl-[acyl-carrier protein] reductase III